MNESFPKQVSQLIDEAGSTMETTSFCTSWILITEWTDGNGRQWLEETRTTDLPAWKRIGILSYIIDDSLSISYDEDEDD